MSRVWRSFKTIEQTAVRRARFSVFTTPGAAREYTRRYPEGASRIVVVENGFDEESFAGLTGADGTGEPLNPGAVTVLHSGIVYPSERDPTCLFAALARLVDGQRLVRGTFRIRFRASAHDGVLRALTQRHRLEDFVELLPPIGYRAALEEMVRADALLILQAANCNEQIPRRSTSTFGRTAHSGADRSARRHRWGAREAGLDSIARLIPQTKSLNCSSSSFGCEMDCTQSLVPTMWNVPRGRCGLGRWRLLDQSSIEI